MLELIYTSARSGLRSGSSGFTFVAWTKGIPPLYVNPLEDLSGYKPVWLPGDPHSSANPVSFSYQKVKYGNLSFSAISRIGYAGLDYSGRSNKTAHHIIASDSELLNSSYGPVGCFLQKDNFISVWNAEPQLLNERNLKAPDEPADCYARTWQKQKGDAGWAGVVAAKIEELLCSGEVTDDAIYLEYTPDLPADEVLHMISEVLLLLPEEIQMRCTFNTYFIQPRIGVDVLLRCTLTDNPVVQTMRRLSPQKVISLMNKEKIPDVYANNPYVQAAQAGGFPVEQTEILPVIEKPAKDNKTIFLNILPPKKTIMKIPVPEKNLFAVKPVGNEPEVSDKSPILKKFMTGFIVCIFLLIALIVLLKRDEFFNKNTDNKNKTIQNRSVYKGAVTNTPDEKTESVNKTFPVQKKDSVKTAASIVPKAEKKKSQKPLQFREKEFTPKDAKEFFVKFNEAIYKKENTVLCTFTEPVEKIEIVTQKGTDAGVDLHYPKNKPLFTLSCKKNEVKIHEFISEAFDENAYIKIRAIKSIRIKLKSCKYTIPFGISMFITEIQPKIELDTNYKITKTDSPELKMWMDKYLIKPEIKLNMFLDLHGAIENYNKSFTEYNQKQQEKEIKEKSAQKTYNQYIKIWNKWLKKTDWEENFPNYEKYRDTVYSLAENAFIQAKTIPELKKQYEKLYDDFKENKPQKYKLISIGTFNKTVEQKCNDFQNVKNELNKKQHAYERNEAELEKEINRYHLQTLFYKWKGKTIPANAPEIKQQLEKIAKEKSKYKIKQ